MDSKIKEWILDETVYLQSLKVSPHKILINYEGGNSNLEEEIWQTTTLTKWLKSRIMRQMDITCLLRTQSHLCGTSAKNV
jgi:hypothetical protein